MKRKIFTGLLVVGVTIYFLISHTTYATFSSDTDHVDFTFQYPSEWSRPIIFVSDNFTNCNLLGPMNIVINNYFNVSSTPSADAFNKVGEYINVYKDSPHFELFSNSELNFGEYTGQRAVFYYDIINHSLNDGENNHVRWQTFVWAFPHSGKVYEIIISYRYEDDKTLWKDQLQFLKTFKIND